MKISETCTRLRKEIAAVLPLIESRILEFPKYPPYKHALDQVRFIDSIAAKGIPPTPIEKANVNIGIMCVKTLDEVDQELTKKLYPISGLFDSLCKETPSL